MGGLAWLCNHTYHLDWPWQHPCILALQSKGDCTWWTGHTKVCSTSHTAAALHLLLML